MESLSPIYFGSLSAVTSSRGANDPQLGDRVRSGKNEYLYVFNASTADLAPGQGCIITGTSGYSVAKTSVTLVDPCLGVVKHTTIPASSYGWIVTRGPVKMEMAADNSVTAGQLVVLGASGVFTQKSISTGYLAPAYAKATETIASGSSGVCFIY